jgi:hypothetical protein
VEFYPTDMIHTETETDIPGRAVYATDIYLWQALTLVRQFITSGIIANMHHRHPDGGVSFYRIIGKAGEAYLRNDTLQRFNETFGMSTKGKQCLQASVEAVKKGVAPIVDDLLVNNTQIKRGPNDLPLPYLTCAEILDEELPWNVRKAQAKRDAENEAKKAAKAIKREADDTEDAEDTEDADDTEDAEGVKMMDVN